MLSDSEKKAFLQRTILHDLSSAGIDEVSAQFEIKEFAPHTEFISQEDDSTRVYVIVSGAVRVFTTNKDGNEIGLAVLGPGDVIGELAFLNEQKRTASVESIQSVTTYSVAGDQFKKLIMKYPLIAINLLKVLNEKIRRQDKVLEDFFARDLKKRTYDMLAIMAQYFPHKSVTISQEELAQIVSATRARVTEALHELQEAGKIKLFHKTIQVL